MNAFKPGTVEQVRQLLAIADAAPHHTIAAHIEGGRAGGHHSWEDLEELLLETYHELRRRTNVLLCAGGGIGTPARAAELLHGTWALSTASSAMPVDGVLIGTAAMACLEAAASPQVKRALVEAGGVAGWVPRRGVEGGVTSARSNLNADIHLLDNSASRAGHLLESVAGDADAVAARRDEIIAALARTAKPYFGDVEAMTYAQVLARFRELCAIGRGAALRRRRVGPSRRWRARFEALSRRFAARLASVGQGRCRPRGWTRDGRRPTLLHPADAQFFLEVCDRPGKPVPFVPVLDAEVRRWYMADGLWQAQDDRLDADAVFVIPGPEAVAGITRADEPVAELLARFEAEAIARVTSPPAPRARLADPGPAPEPIAASGRTARSARCSRPSAWSRRTAAPARTRCGAWPRPATPSPPATTRSRSARPGRPASRSRSRRRGDALVTVETGVTAPLVLRYRPLRARSGAGGRSDGAGDGPRRREARRAASRRRRGAPRQPRGGRRRARGRRRRAVERGARVAPHAVASSTATPPARRSRPRARRRARAGDPFAV